MFMLCKGHGISLFKDDFSQDVMLLLFLSSYRVQQTVGNIQMRLFKASNGPRMKLP